MNMTSEEKRLIADCRIAVVGATEFIDSIKAELQQLGFESIQIISSYDKQPAISNFDIIAENVNAGSSCMSNVTDIPLILPFLPSDVSARGVSLWLIRIFRPQLRIWKS